MPAQPSRPAQSGAGGGGKRGNIGTAGGGARDRSNAATSSGKSSALKRHDKGGPTGGASRTSAKGDSAATAMDAILADQDGPVQESKKIRKRKEVVDRIHRVHWDTLENRDLYVVVVR